MCVCVCARARAHARARARKACLVISMCICLLIAKKAIVQIKVVAYYITTGSLNAHTRGYEVTVEGTSDGTQIQ